MAFPGTGEEISTIPESPTFFDNEARATDSLLARILPLLPERVAEALRTYNAYNKTATPDFDRYEHLINPGRRGNSTPDWRLWEMLNHIMGMKYGNGIVYTVKTGIDDHSYTGEEVSIDPAEEGRIGLMPVVTTRTIERPRFSALGRSFGRRRTVVQRVHAFAVIEGGTVARVIAFSEDPIDERAERPLYESMSSYGPSPTKTKLIMDAAELEHLRANIQSTYLFANSPQGEAFAAIGRGTAARVRRPY